MKRKYVIASVAFLFSVGIFAQKNELKTAEKALKAGNSIEAQSVLNTNKALFENATPVEKAQYHLLNGNAHLDLAKKNTDVSKNLEIAASSFQYLIDIEKDEKKKKFSEQATASIIEIRNLLINAGVTDGKDQKFKEASQKMKMVYDLDKSQPEFLYYAASYAVNAVDYDTALAYYDELKRIKYTGEKTLYKATSILTEEQENFASKVERDMAVKSKTYHSPKDEQVPSQLGEILSNYALILIQKGEIEKAKNALAEAKKESPKDVSLIVAEANLYLNLDDYATYKRLIEEAVKSTPDNPDLYYNLGVASMKVNSNEEAEKYFLKAIELKADYSDAYLNMGALILGDDQKIIDQMDKLGNSAKDNKRYEELKKERNVLLAKALPFMEKAVEHGNNDLEILRTMMNMYYTLDLDDKYKAMKARVDKLTK
jgi:tetratricopeptide (TPR) repeat protein